eukprot:gene12526-16801_t
MLTWSEYLCRGVISKSSNQLDFADSISNDLLTKYQKRISKYLIYSGLTPFSASVAVQFLQSRLSDEGGADKLQRVISFIVSEINHSNKSNKSRLQIDNRIKYTSQCGCPNIIPGLRAKPFWNRNDFTWVEKLEESFELIKQEFLNLKSYNSNSGLTSSGFQHYRSPIILNENDNNSDYLGRKATDTGDWNVCYLYLHGLDFNDNLQRCPLTASIIKSIPNHYHHAFFSALAPNSHVIPHFGPTNKKLRCHLPLVIPKDESNSSAAWLRVGGETVQLHEGQCVIFDDSFQHEAGNDSHDKARVVLIIDVWHPDLTAEEIHWLSFVNNAQVKAAQRLRKSIENQQQEVESSSNDKTNNHKNLNNQNGLNDFFGVIQHSHIVGICKEDVSSIWSGTNDELELGESKSGCHVISHIPVF